MPLLGIIRPRYLHFILNYMIVKTFLRLSCGFPVTEILVGKTAKPWWWKHFCVTGPLWGESIGLRRVDSPHKCQWRGGSMFSLIYAWTNDWASNRDAGDLRRYRAHHDVTVVASQEICKQIARSCVFMSLRTQQVVYDKNVVLPVWRFPL